MKKLWGANFFNAKTKKWGKTKTEDNVRSFCQFILDPIYKMFDAIMNFKKEDTDKLLDKLELKGKMKYEELQLEGKWIKYFCLKTTFRRMNNHRPVPKIIWARQTLSLTTIFKH